MGFLRGKSDEDNDVQYCFFNPNSTLIFFEVNPN